MRMRLYSLIFLLVSCSVFADGAKVAVVDLKKVAAESLAGKDIEKQMKAINNESKTDLLDLENQIKSMDNSKKTDLDTRKIEELQVVLYDMVREKKYTISAAYNQAISHLDKEIKQVVRDICKRKKLSVVIAQDAVIYFDNSDCKDITQETIKELNKRCKSIKVEVKETN